MSLPEIPGYTVRRVLGKGGMATVYLATDDRFGRDVALKVMTSLSADAGFRERLLGEARIVARISHPNIVAVYDVNEANGLHYIAMEYHAGGDLKARLREGISVREALAVTRDVARALDHAHGEGYLHRDIKPDNVLLRMDGSAVLADFGIARATEGDASLARMGRVAGTPKYMSPEQARGLTRDAGSDLYSLGVMLFEMLTGRLPYEAADPVALGILHMNAPIPKLEGRIAHFQPLVDRLLAKQPTQRPPSGAQVIREIEALEKGFDFEGVRVPPEHDQTITRPAAGRKPAVVAAASPDGPTRLVPSASAPVPEPATAPRPLLKVAVAVVLALALAGAAGWWVSRFGSAQDLQKESQKLETVSSPREGLPPMKP